MKGIVFTEFFEMVEQEFGYSMVDDMIENTDLDSKGIYTSIGTYEHSEMVDLLGYLHKKSNIPIPDLLNAFGKYLFNTFIKNYPSFFSVVDNSFDFLESIEDHIHVEVRKLYPDAQLPSFETERIDENILKMKYISERSMSDFALGLMQKTIEHYGETIAIERENIDEKGKQVLFTLTKK